MSLDDLEGVLPPFVPAPVAHAGAFTRHSAKLQALLEALEIVKARDEAVAAAGGAPDKVVVYSQFTSYMDLIETAVRDRLGWRTLRLDGSMAPAARAATLEQFNTNPTLRVIVVSLKAGGVGINLCVANHIFLMDPWWNTPAEQQAVDRVNRIGQTKKVYVTRFVVANTVEERMLGMQAKKDLAIHRALEQSPRPGRGATGRALVRATSPTLHHLAVTKLYFYCNSHPVGLYRPTIRATLQARTLV